MFGDPGDYKYLRIRSPKYLKQLFHEYVNKIVFWFL